ncbi:MAG TPA: GntR family transcriptional regulator [Desulfosporosinus sp.]|nr:GntR family transcriptional regulator [Desulfosporosinus sp.]
MKLSIENLNAKAYEEIKSLIISKKLEPGARLVDSQLAEQYGISRTPIRDAIRKLTEDGLVVKSKTKGYNVFQATRQDIIEIFELRLMMDKEIITKLITEMVPDNIDYYIPKLKEIDDYLNESNDSIDPDFIKIDENFHDSLIAFSNNSRLISFYKENRDQTKAFRRVTFTSEERKKSVLESHKKILNGIINLDLNGAIGAVTEHIIISRRNALVDFDAN